MRRLFWILWLAVVLSGGCQRESGSTSPVERGADAASREPAQRDAEPPRGDAAVTPEGAPPDGDDRESLCARAARCCAAAFAVEDIPRIYAERREQACAVVEGIPDGAGCRAAIASWRRMVGGVEGATVPEPCEEQ